MNLLLIKLRTIYLFFQNKIIVVDRLYFSYNLINFFIENNVHFIIRCKGECKFKSTKIDYSIMEKIKIKTRVVHNTEIVDKNLTISNKFKKDKSKTIAL